MKVVVVGGGIMGLCSAWGLTKRGHAVTLVEQSAAIPNPFGASGDEHRIIRRAYGNADGYARTITDAFAAWEELWADLGARHYAERGVMGISQVAGDEAEEYRDGLDRTGHPYRLMEPGDAARLYPFLDPATFRYAYVSPEGGALLCGRIATGLVTWLRHHGAVLRTGAQVVELDDGAGRIVLAGGETIVADRLVVTAGAWTLRLLPALSDALTIYRTAVAYLEPPAAFREAWERAPAILDVGGTVDGYVLPPVDGTGLKVGAGVHKRLSPDPDADRAVAPGEGERIRDLFAPPFRRIADYAVSRVASCVYTFTHDHRFVGCRIGERALAVSACSGHGYKFGAAVGRRVAEAVESGDVTRLSAWLRAEDDA